LEFDAKSCRVYRIRSRIIIKDDEVDVSDTVRRTGAEARNGVQEVNPLLV
jgi:hypothetical protein